jgi:hypothetical protein
VQALPTQGLLLNRHHPDAPGCFFAVPVMERGGEVVRDVAWRGSKGLGQPVWTGTRSYANLRGGRAIVTSVGNIVGTPLSGTPWSGFFSVMATVKPAGAGASSGIVRCGGFILGQNASLLQATLDSNSALYTSALTLAQDVEYRIGFRYGGTGAGLVSAFVNGVKETGTAAQAATTASVPTQLGGTGAGNQFAGMIRDVRIWSRFLPDAAFERYYTNPNAFYTTGRVWGFRWGGTGAVSRMFWPFLISGRRRA